MAKKITADTFNFSPCPPNYLCKKCQETGKHWIMNCRLKTIHMDSIDVRNQTKDELQSNDKDQIYSKSHTTFQFCSNVSEYKQNTVKSVEEMSESVDSNQNSDDDVKDSPQEIAKPIEPIAQKSKNKKQHKPIHSTQIHVSGHKNAFTYQLPNGKRKVDQSLKRFCTQHKCIGVFEVKLHLKQFGFKLNNVNKIKYDANDNGVSLKYDSVRDGFDVFINYPSNITIKVLRNPKAICVGNKVLLCRIPITSHNLTLRSYNPHKQPKLGVIGGKKQRKWNDKMTAKLQRNHQQINQNKTKLTGFQRSLYGIPSEKHKTF